MGDPVKRRATYEDLMAVPDIMIAEIIDGELVTQPRPASLHAIATSALLGDLRGPFQRGKGGPGGWIILFEPELHLHGDVLVPDIAGWRRERMPEAPDAAAFELAPDWVCEALSPSNPAHNRVRKMPIYARDNVAHLWLVDPRGRTLEAYRRRGAGLSSAPGATTPRCASSRSKPWSSSSGSSGRAELRSIRRRQPVHRHGIDERASCLRP